jgi:hypothetical protein
MAQCDRQRWPARLALKRRLRQQSCFSAAGESGRRRSLGRRDPDGFLLRDLDHVPFYPAADKVIRRDLARERQ